MNAKPTAESASIPVPVFAKLAQVPATPAQALNRTALPARPLTILFRISLDTCDATFPVLNNTSALASSATPVSQTA